MRNLYVSLGFALALLAPLSANSQSNFVPGTVTFTGGEPVGVLINYKDWLKSPKRITIKTDKDAKPKEYSAFDIETFETQGQIFIGRIVTYDASPHMTKDLTSSPKALLKKDTLFVQVLVTGSKSLYQIRDENDKEHFFINQNDSLTELIQRRYLSVNNVGNTVAASLDLYKNQLLVYLNDCPDLYEAISKLSYGEKNMLSLFNQYYSCSTNQPQYFKERKAHFGNLFFSLGMSNTALAFTGDVYARTGDMTFPHSTDFTGSIGLEAYFPKRLNRLSFVAEVGLISYSTKDSIYYSSGISSIYSEVVTFNQAYVKSHWLLRYSLEYKSLIGFVNGGFCMNFATTNENNWIKTHYLFGNQSVLTEPAIKNPKNTEVGYALGMGLRYRFLQLEYRFEKNNGMSDYIGAASNITRHYVQFGLIFKI